METLSVEKVMTKAKSREKKGDLAEAKKLYLKILERFPENKRARDRLAFLQRGNAHSFGEVPAEATVDLLIELYKQKQFSAMAEKAETLSGQFPDSFMVWSLLGAAYKGLGKLEEARIAFERVTFLNPGYADGFNNLAVVLQEQGDVFNAAKAYQKAILINPDYCEAHYNLGNALRHQGMLGEAIVSYKKALLLNSDYVDAHNNIGAILADQKKFDEAITAFKRALRIEPSNSQAKHLMSSLKGETTNTAPKEYVESLFDDYANRFDEALVEKLEYQTPKILSDIIQKFDKRDTLGSILDLGCGTGLFGREVRGICDNLEGIDLSRAMLTRAYEKNIYNKLYQTDISDYLANAQLDFDYFVAADVFVYMGDLSDVFRLVRSNNQRPGKLVFSTEHLEGKGFQLRNTGRYAHSRHYVERLCDEHNYRLNYFSTTNLRKDRGEVIVGGVYLLYF